MATDDHEILARIGQLAGQINRHKNQQAGVAPATSHHNPAQYHAGHGNNTWTRGGGPYTSRGGYRGSSLPAHRHRSLVLNGANQQNNKGTDVDSGTTSDASNSSWVTKNDRHLQLINSSIYEKDSQARTRAIEQTRRQKLAKKDGLERAKLAKHMNRMVNSAGTANPQGPANKYEIAVQGIQFLVAKNGSKLVKAPGDNNSAKATPKMVVIGGVKFYRSKNGNLYRHGVVKAQRYVSRYDDFRLLTSSVTRRSGIVKKVNVPCKMFSTTGSCPQGPRCRYTHDPSKVAICKNLLQKGECANGDACDLSHELTPERTPTCLHFAKDHCTNPSCRYSHVKVSPGAPVCRPFGIYGYCEKGGECSERHSFECPDFSNTGTCKTKGCKLLHRERASVLRKMNARDNQNDDEDMEDVSSDEDGDSVDSYDVDSDEVEEFIGQDEDVDIAGQKDFIQL